MKNMIGTMSVSLILLLFSGVVLATSKTIEAGAAEISQYQLEIFWEEPKTQTTRRQYASAHKGETRSEKGKPNQERKNDTTQRDTAGDSVAKSDSKPDTGEDTDTDSDDDTSADADSGSKSGPNAQSKGNETSAEMRARRDERKQIKEEYQDGEKPENRSGKKPWWKFWEPSPE